MAPYEGEDDVFGSGASRYLSASNTMSPRRSPSRQSLLPRRSSASLRGASSLGHAMDDDAANGRHSLAHELAVALMPEPSAGSKLLAEEFGIEYDEGAEGIDGDAHHSDEAPQIVVDDSTSFASELDSEAMDSSFHNTPEGDQAPQLYDPILDSPSAASRTRKQEKKDAMEILAENLESTDQFLLHLRRIDTDIGSSSSQQPALERIASDVIRRLNDTARDREGQVRALLEYEREFRKIAGEVGGSDVLGQLEELTGIEELGDEKPLAESSRAEESLDDEPLSPRHNEWDNDIDHDHHRNLADDDDHEFDAHPSSLKDSFSPPPPITGPPTPAVTLPQLADLRSFTTTLVSSLTTISEQTQINGAATTEAGRKIRALKNKIGGWRTDWDSAERSRARIERWEAGIADGADTPDGDIPTGSKRVDGRRFVEEHLQAFELALADAAVKTKAIMAAS
ncbi:hypothetical protein BDZ89DRAFT_1064004 [Hymenopellis radicata]|nr:hypothetical protein BDZ89DRAFT_1064004 [Hymenopellis radicata]